MKFFVTMTFDTVSANSYLGFGRISFYVKAPASLFEEVLPPEAQGELARAWFESALKDSSLSQFIESGTVSWFADRRQG